MCLYIYSSIISLFSCLFILFLSKINEYFGSPWLILYFLNISKQPLLFFYNHNIWLRHSIKPKDFETPWIPFWILNIWAHPTYRWISFLRTNNIFENEQYFWERTIFLRTNKIHVNDDVVLIKNERWTNALDRSDKWKKR